MIASNICKKYISINGLSNEPYLDFFYYYYTIKYPFPHEIFREIHDYEVQGNDRLPRDSLIFPNAIKS